MGTRDKVVLLDWEGVLEALPLPIVLDHIAWIPQPEGRNSKSAGLARRLLANPKNYVKLSWSYLSSRLGPPDYRDMDEVATELAEMAPKQFLWGSDWPHPIALLNGHLPDGAALFDQLSRWIPDPARRQLALVDNPHWLYWSR